MKRLREQVCGGVAQLARATGSYPVGHGFKSNLRYHRPVGQAAKTPPFHGGNGSSILPRVTKLMKALQKRCLHQFGDSIGIERALSARNIRALFYFFKLIEMGGIM